MSAFSDDNAIKKFKIGTEEFDAKNEENNLSNMAGRYASSFINDLYKKAEVKDDRYLYF